MRRVISLPRVIGIGSLSKIDLTNEYQVDEGVLMRLLGHECVESA